MDLAWPTSFALSLTAAFNPSLFAALMVMLVSANAKRLMLGYLLGAYLTAITSGLVIVFALPDSGAVDTTQDTLSPGPGPGAGRDRDRRRDRPVHRPQTERGSSARERRRRKREEKGPPRWQRALDRGSPRVAFAVGAVLSFPGASYLVALGLLHREDLSTAATVVSVIAFCLIELILLELPLIGFAVAPDRTVAAIARFRAFVTHDARRIGAWAAFVVGALLLIRGAIELLS